MGGSLTNHTIGTPGDRSDESVRSVGNIAGKSFHRIIIKEDKNSRGRKPGEISQILMEGVLSAGISKKAVTLIQREDDALRAAIQEASAGDIIVVFYEDLECITNVINQETSKVENESNKKDLSKIVLVKA